jgi:hypothetical protein
MRIAIFNLHLKCNLYKHHHRHHYHFENAISMHSFMCLCVCVCDISGEHIMRIFGVRLQHEIKVHCGKKWFGLTILYCDKGIHVYIMAMLNGAYESSHALPYPHMRMTGCC